MNFDFSDDQQMLRTSVRKFMDDNCTLADVRKVFLDDSLPYDKKVWKGLADLGVLGAAIDEAHGGAGLSMLEVCVVAEECGRALAPTPFSSSIYLAAEAIKLAGTAAQKEKWLPRLAAGSAIGTFAFAEGTKPPHAKNIQTTFANGKLSGEKTPVPDGSAADVAVVVAKEGGKIIFALAELAGVKRADVKTIDPTRKHAAVKFDKSAAEKLAGAEGVGLLNQLLDRAAVLMAFEQLGAAERALDFARDYANERYAFGRPIGSFQAIKHKLADAYVLNQLARSNCYYAAMVMEDEGDLPTAAAAARLSATEAFMYIAEENVQTHGGVGFTWEADTQFFYRRAKLLALALGAPPRWQERLIQSLEKRNVA